MVLCQHGHCFQLNKNFLLDQYVGEKFAHNNPFKSNLDRILLCDVRSHLTKRNNQSIFVNFFNITNSQGVANCICTSCDGIVFLVVYLYSKVHPCSSVVKYSYLLVFKCVIAIANASAASSGLGMASSCNNARTISCTWRLSAPP